MLLTFLIRKEFFNICCNFYERGKSKCPWFIFPQIFLSVNDEVLLIVSEKVFLLKKTKSNFRVHNCGDMTRQKVYFSHNKHFLICIFIIGVWNICVKKIDFNMFFFFRKFRFQYAFYVNVNFLNLLSISTCSGRQAPRQPWRESSPRSKPRFLEYRTTCDAKYILFTLYNWNISTVQIFKILFKTLRPKPWTILITGD